MHMLALFLLSLCNLFEMDRIVALVNGGACRIAMLPVYLMPETRLSKPCYPHKLRMYISNHFDVSRVVLVELFAS